MDEQPIQTFINRWSKSGGAERANYQLFLSELCDVLGVPRPEPTVQDDSQNAYVFERNVEFDNRDGTRSTKRIDLYKRGCFVLESKQGVQQQDDSPVLSAKQQELRAKRKRGAVECERTDDPRARAGVGAAADPRRIGRGGGRRLRLARGNDGR